MKYLNSLFFTLITGVVVSPSFAGGAPEAGCYRPLKGFATSICTDSTCARQEGVYHILLKNDAHILRLRGSFQGYVIQSPNQCGGFTLNHLFIEKRYQGTLSSGGDQACPTGGDGITTLEVHETINLQVGNGIYAGLESGTLEFTGTIHLTTGISIFKLVSGTGEICFEDNDSDSQDKK